MLLRAGTINQTGGEGGWEKKKNARRRAEELEIKKINVIYTQFLRYALHICIYIIYTRARARARASYSLLNNRQAIGKLNELSGNSGAHRIDHSDKLLSTRLEGIDIKLKTQNAAIARNHSTRLNLRLSEVAVAPARNSPA